ncbi:MAG TPA: hypothetical protein VNC22_22895 [Sporichthya sp.]|jgi:hypothetical protein|nr:hypothetical protein [Sporichthya sp.]
MTDDEIMALASIVSDLARGREPVSDGECVLCQHMLAWFDTSGPVPVPYTPAEWIDQHAPECPWRRAKELFG